MLPGQRIRAGAEGCPIQAIIKCLLPVLLCEMGHGHVTKSQPRTGTSQLVPPGPSSIENDAHGIEKLLLKLK